LTLTKLGSISWIKEAQCLDSTPTNLPTSVTGELAVSRRFFNVVNRVNLSEMIEDTQYAVFWLANYNTLP
jgi:hypothetical protein